MRTATKKQAMTKANRKGLTLEEQPDNEMMIVWQAMIDAPSGCHFNHTGTHVLSVVTPKDQEMKKAHHWGNVLDELEDVELAFCNSENCEHWENGQCQQ